MQTDHEFLDSIFSDASNRLMLGVTVLLEKKDTEISRLAEVKRLLETHCGVALSLMAEAKLSPETEPCQQMDWQNAVRHLRLALDSTETQIPAKRWGIRFPSRGLTRDTEPKYLHIHDLRPCLVSRQSQADLFFSETEALKTALRHCTCAVSLGFGAAELFELKDGE